MGRFDKIFDSEVPFSDLSDFSGRAADLFYRVISSPEGVPINVEGLKKPFASGNLGEKEEGILALDYKDYLIFFGREGKGTVTTRLLEQRDLGGVVALNRASLEGFLVSSYESNHNPRKFFPGELDGNLMIIRSMLKSNDIGHLSAGELWDSYWYSAGKAVYQMILGSKKIT